ncbi:MAG: hypothetical protein ACI9UA_002649 [Pseudoalteromonas tetraodonis]|jgi:hypothetical protein
MKRLTIYACIWAALLALLFVFSASLDDKLWVLYLPIHWGVPFAGGTLLLIGLVRAIRESVRRHPLQDKEAGATQVSMPVHPDQYPH